MTEKPKPIKSFILSHKGLVRSNNEDCAAVLESCDFGDKKPTLAVLADGIGGHNAGEVASRIAVDTIITSFNQMKPSDPLTMLESAILAANQKILDNINDHPDRKGMGTTCVCALIIGKTLYAAHLGDSRLYLLRTRKLSQLTNDHTLFEEFKHLVIRQSDNNTRSHPMAHVLSRYLGSRHVIDVDKNLIGIVKTAESFNLKSDDILLLCSDGLTDLLTDDEITHILLTCAGRKRAQSLIYRALENGGHDNTTVIVLKIP